MVSQNYNLEKVNLIGFGGIVAALYEKNPTKVNSIELVSAPYHCKKP
jgi:hypothetical protein